MIDLSGRSLKFKLQLGITWEITTVLTGSV